MTTVSARACLECGRAFMVESHRVASGGGRYCGQACYRAARSVSAADRFWSHTDRRAETGCWEWRGALQFGYGRLRVNGKATRAHRHAYVLARGPIPDGLEVCHRCDNRACVNPDHLFLGTQSENAADMVQKGRSTRGMRTGPTKLTQESANEVRRLYEGGGISMRDLGKRYGVGATAVFMAVHNRSWRTNDAPRPAVLPSSEEAGARE